MNYDAAHALAKSMRESEEYKGLMKAQKAVEADADALKMVKDFLSLQMQWEYSKMAGSEEEPNLLKQLQDLTLLVNNNGLARDYLQAYTYWSQVSQDVYRIVSEPITEGMSILEKQ